MGSTSFRKQIFSPSSSLLQRKEFPKPKFEGWYFKLDMHIEKPPTTSPLFLEVGLELTPGLLHLETAMSKVGALPWKAGLGCFVLQRSWLCRGQNIAYWHKIMVAYCLHRAQFTTVASRSQKQGIVDYYYYYRAFFFPQKDHDQMVVNLKGCPRTTNLSSNSKVISQAIAPKCLRAESWHFPHTDGNGVGWRGLQGLWSLPKWSRWMDMENSLMDG